MRLNLLTSVLAGIGVLVLLYHFRGEPWTPLRVAGAVVGFLGMGCLLLARYQLGSVVQRDGAGARAGDNRAVYADTQPDLCVRLRVLRGCGDVCAVVVAGAVACRNGAFADEAGA